jgi:hypothetical protein
MPRDSRVVEVKLPEAEVLADLYGIVFDLDAAAYLCDRAIELSQPRSRDSLVVEGLVAAAVIRYGRCFASGVRFGLTSTDLGDLGHGALESHGYFKDLRDKFVAHSVNPFEETFVTATATEQGGVKLPIRAIGPGQHRLVLSASTAEALGRLISDVNAVVGKRVAAEERRLLRVIQGLPLEAIHGGDLHTPRRLAASDVSKSRKVSSSRKARKGILRKGRPR